MGAKPSQAKPSQAKRRRSPPAVEAHVRAQPLQPLAEVGLDKGLRVVNVGGGAKRLAAAAVAPAAVLVLVAWVGGRGGEGREKRIRRASLVLCTARLMTGTPNAEAKPAELIAAHSSGRSMRLTHNGALVPSQLAAKEVPAAALVLEVRTAVVEHRVAQHLEPLPLQRLDAPAGGSGSGMEAGNQALAVQRSLPRIPCPIAPQALGRAGPHCS